MVRTNKSLSGVHLLCCVRKFQEARSQLQDAGCWTDAATLFAMHLTGFCKDGQIMSFTTNMISGDWGMLLLLKYFIGSVIHVGVTNPTPHKQRLDSWTCLPCDFVIGGLL